MKTEIIPVNAENIQIYRKFDKHISDAELKIKILENRASLIKVDNIAAGVLRWSLFWDEIPFLNLIILSENFRGKGIGKEIMQNWETKMKEQNYKMLLVSTQSDENAQYFYQKLGYINIGSLEFPGQAPELFFRKELSCHSPYSSIG